MSQNELAACVAAGIIPSQYAECLTDEVKKQLPNDLKVQIHGGGIMIYTPEGLEKARQMRAEANRSRGAKIAEAIAKAAGCTLASALVVGGATVLTCWACDKIKNK